MLLTMTETEELSQMRDNIRRSVDALEQCWSCQRVSECEPCGCVPIAPPRTGGSMLVSKEDWLGLLASNTVVIEAVSQYDPSRSYIKVSRQSPCLRSHWAFPS